MVTSTSVVSDIVDKIKQKEHDTQSLRKRFDDDYSLWRLDPYREPGMDNNYKAFTSNEPRVNAKKAIGMLSSAVTLLTVPQGNDDRDSRDADNDKEKFLRGCFKANDQRLVRLGKTGPLQQHMAWSLMIRGYTCGRVLLRKQDERSWADATPWDARHTYWEYGPNGLDWICHQFSILRSAAPKEWKLPRADKPEELVISGYDYYDDTRNYVIIPDVQQQAVKNELHGLVDGDGMPQVPGWVMANTLQPDIMSIGTVGKGATRADLFDSLQDFGESFFADGRRTYAYHNLISSIRLELASRSRTPAFGIKSITGVKLVESDPFINGPEIPLQIGEELVVYDFLRAAADTDPLAAQIIAELQKSGFPVISFGGLPDPISGYAIQNLKGGVADKVVGGAQAISHAKMQISDIWSDHFSTNAFGGLQLSGQGRNRKWFSAFIEPDSIRDLPQAQITIIPELPEDLSGKIQQAIQLRTPGPDGLPLLSSYTVREDYLSREDSDMDMDSILQEMAAKHPLVEAARYVDALAKRGDQNALIWQAQFTIMAQQMEQSGALPPGFSGQEGAGDQGGFSPDVLPREAQGIPSPTPGVDTPFQRGPVVPQGTPRPGAQRNGRLRQGVPPIP